jgi:hypothetical protein
MIHEAWIVINKASWDAIDPSPQIVMGDIIEYQDDGEGNMVPVVVGQRPEKITVPPEPWHKVYQQAVTGFWKVDVYNVIGDIADIQALVTELGDPPAYAWTQGDGLDSLDILPTDPDAILALMKDHVTYSDDGSEASRTPATFENPNWGHAFLGQRPRVFAGEFSDEFSEEFF